METSTASPMRGSRKRQRHPEEWGRNKRKKLRNLGQEYVSTAGKVVPPRRPGNECRCAMHCFERITAIDQNKIFKEFNELGSFDLQNAYLHGLIKGYEPKRRYTSQRSESRRQRSYSYHVRAQGKECKVCLKAFLSIHGVSNKRVMTARKGQTTPTLDQRGKHDKRPNKTPPNAVDAIKSHILSFPRQMSHYSRHDNPNRRYLSPELSITKMHQLYMQKCDEIGYPPVSESVYRSIFCANFNLSFGSPKTDTCKTCDELRRRIEDVSDEHSKSTLRLELTSHQMKAEDGYTRLREDTALAQSAPHNYHMITFDAQQNLPTPHMHTSLVFYLRQLWVYNIGIHNCGAGDATMCMWPENVAKKGSDEVASCLLRYFNLLTTRPGHLLAYSDSCAGQNKSFYTVCFWVYLVLHGYFSMVDHKFLTPGHTFLPSDRDFGLIEKRKREREVFVPNQWYRLVEETRVRSPFKVASMEQEHFKDIKKFSQHFINRKKTKSGENIEFRKVSWIRVSSSNPTDIFLKYTLNDSEEWKIMSIARRGAQPKPPITLEQKYTGPVEIDEKKLNDLKRLTTYIPRPYHGFYESLMSKPHEGDSDAEILDQD